MVWSQSKVHIEILLYYSAFPPKLGPQDGEYQNIKTFTIKYVSFLKER